MLQYINENALHPFIPKNNKVYTTDYKGEKGVFKKAYPFKVNEEEAQIFASVNEYTGVANLALSIVKKSNNNIVAVSSPGKYHSYLAPVTLTRGDYYLVIF